MDAIFSAYAFCASVETKPVAAMLTARDARTTRRSPGLSASMVTRASTMVKPEEMSCISPTCMTEETFSRSLVTRLMMSPVLWVSK